MRYFYDTEFLEDGKTIDLISIGILAEDGREYYAVNGSAPWNRVFKHEWLRENVVPHLPMSEQVDGSYLVRQVDTSHADVKPRNQIAQEVQAFLRPNPEDYRHTELWAWCGAYDHVVTYQLWGPMADVHGTGLPFYTNDLKSVHDLFLTDEQRQVVRSIPVPGDAAHNALADARQLKDRHDYVFSIVDRVEFVG